MVKTGDEPTQITELCAGQYRNRHYRQATIVHPQWLEFLASPHSAARNGDSSVVAGLFGYWHALYAWVIGLSVLTAAFFLVSYKASLGIATALTAPILKIEKANARDVERL